MSVIRGGNLVEEIVLEMRGITKRFPGVLALNNVDFAVKLGEVHVLIGENGAGKSTLIKILGGAYTKDEGQVYIKGEPVEIYCPQDAMNLGISVIHQELNMVLDMNVAQNMFLGQEPTQHGIINWDKIYSDTQKILLQYGLDIDPRTPVRRLGIGVRQMIEIAKNLSIRNAEIVVMDEPTAALTFDEVEELFKLIASLKKRGVSIIYISHRIEEVFRIGDCATVLRDGSTVGTVSLTDVTADDLIQMMIGHNISEFFPKQNAPSSEEALRIENLCTSKLKDINFFLRKGEILGIAGLVGAGRTELARAIFGADPKISGNIIIFGTSIQIRCPGDAIRCGIGFLPEDRGRQGIIPLMDICSNITLSVIYRICRCGFVRKSYKYQIALQYKNRLGIRAPSLKMIVKNLSGGNQQKVILARWLVTDAKIIIFDEPTRGIDVGAKEEIYKLMSDLANQGVAIIMISSDLNEVLGMSDRILVMREGMIVGELDQSMTNKEEILQLATGGNK